MGEDPAERLRKKVRRQADLAMVLAYHEEQLGLLLDRIRDGFVRFDAGEINAFELDAVVHHYSRSAKELWKFCGDGESRIDQAASSIENGHANGQLPDWWEVGDPERRRR